MKAPLKAHATDPRGMGALANATHAASGENPVCGDRLRFEARVDTAGRVEALGFRATACPACVAVASCAVEVLPGTALPIESPAQRLRARIEELGGLSSFEGHALALVEDVLRQLAP